MPERRHGTQYSYKKGCHCESCTAANQEQHARARARKREYRQARSAEKLSKASLAQEQISELRRLLMFGRKHARLMARYRRQENYEL